MRNSSKQMLATAILLTLLGGGAAGEVYAATPVSVNGTTESATLSNVSITNPSYVVRVSNNGILKATGTDNTNISLSGTKEGTGYWYNVMDMTGGQVTLGDESTQNVNITAEGGNPTGVIAYTGGSKVNITGKDVHITAHGDTYAAGIHAQSNDVTRANPSTININADNTVIDVSTDKATFDGGENQAIGIISYSGSTVNITGNLTVNAPTVISTRGNSEVNINQDGKGTVKLNGDISFNYNGPTSGTGIDSNVNINLTDADSVLNGNVIKTGNAPSEKATVDKMTLSLSNNATWNSTAGSFVNNLNLSNGGTVNLNGDTHTIDVVNKLSSDGGVVSTANLDSKLVLDSGATNNVKKLTVKGTGAMADQIAKDSTVASKLANVVTTSDDTSKSIATNVTTDEGVIAGAYNGTVNADGTVSGKQSINTSNQGISSMAAISMMTWRQENNDMNKRLGEIRDSKGKEGVWARMVRGEAKYDARNIKNQYNYYQLGYDTRVSDNWIVGGAFTYTDGESSFTKGNGPNKHTGFAVYGSQLRDDGSFIDLIARYAHMKNDFDTVTGAGNGDYSTNGYSISAEYGKRFYQDNGFWIEPQAELTYGYITSADFTTDRGVRAHQDSMDSFVGRLGVSLGKDIERGNVYVRASYLYDFDGDAKMHMNYGDISTPFSEDLGGGWWEFGVGTNLNLGHDTHFYADLEKTTGGDVTTPWQWNAGFRFSF